MAETTTGTYFGPRPACSIDIMLSIRALGSHRQKHWRSDIRIKGYNFSNIAFKNADEKTTDLYLLGDGQQYGYKALRIYPQTLLDQLRSMVYACNIPITYGKKFHQVLSESPSGVCFAFADGTSASARLLIGTDGIHSSVRKYVSPTTPTYSGILAITCAIASSALQFPADKDYLVLPVAVHGAFCIFVLAPQDVDGSEILIGIQKRYPEQTR
ncbi:MAG: hypothetical protein Q9223_000311 [Gallowayella weberi]